MKEQPKDSLTREISSRDLSKDKRTQGKQPLEKYEKGILTARDDNR